MTIPPAGVPLTLELAVTTESIAALESDYQRLATATGNRLPFALPAWHLTWCDFFLRREPRIQDQPLFFVFRNPRGDCVAILPMIRTRRRIGPLDVGSVDLLGADPALTEIRSPMIEAGFEAAVARGAHELLLQLKQWDWVNWAGVSPNFGQALDAVSAPDWYATTTDYILDLPASWEELRTGLKRNIRESLRHCYNSLRREGHEFEFVAAEQPEAVRAALDRFFELHAMRANMAGGVTHPNRFASPVARDFLLAVCMRLAADGVTRVFQMKIAGVVVATRIGFVVGDSLYLYYSGFDPEWGRYSVMTTTMAEALKYAISLRLATVNLSPGTDVGKTRWGPREVKLCSGFVQSRRLLSGLACWAYFEGRFGNSALARLVQYAVPARRDWS